MEQISVSARTYCPQRCAVRQCRSCIYRDGCQTVGQARIVFPKRDLCKCDGSPLCKAMHRNTVQALHSALSGRSAQGATRSKRSALCALSCEIVRCKNANQAKPLARRKGTTKRRSPEAFDQSPHHAVRATG
jgi:hypothetical protein